MFNYLNQLLGFKKQEPTLDEIKNKLVTLNDDELWDAILNSQNIAVVKVAMETPELLHKLAARPFYPFFPNPFHPPEEKKAKSEGSRFARLCKIHREIALMAVTNMEMYSLLHENDILDISELQHCIKEIIKDDPTLREKIDPRFEKYLDKDNSPSFSF